MKTFTRIATTLLTVFTTLGFAQNVTMYVGTYTRGSSKGIYAYKFHTTTGKLTGVGLAGESSNPSFLAVHPNQRFLYAVNENTQGMVSAFAIDSNGNLKAINQVSSNGADPCHLSIDKTGKWLFVANYSSGSVAVYPIKADGSIGEASATFQHAGKSVNAERQSGPHAHMAAISPDNRFVWVCDLGLDEILSYRIDPAKGMTPNNPKYAKVEPGSGPRHVVFRADSKFAYVVDEMGATVTVFSYDAANGTMKQQLQVISTLPAGYSGTKSGAEIALHPSQKFLYTSNRGHDSIAIFKVDDAKGTLTFSGTVPTGGKTPRNFVIDPAGNLLFAANQDSNSITVFRVDQQTGGLTPTGDKYDIGAPVSLVFQSSALAAK